MKRLFAFITILGPCLVWLFLSCNHQSPTAGNGSDLGNAVIKGMLFNQDKTPAVGVSVTIYSENYQPSLAKASAGTETITDTNGQYSLPLPDSGRYHIIGISGNDKAVYIDSVIVKDTHSVEVHADTVRAPGRITGISFMPGLDSINQIRVTMYIPGTGFITKPNIGGAFSFTKVPQGKYRLIFDPTNENYDVKIMEVTVVPGQTTDLDTVLLYGKTFTGKPVISLSNDTVVSVNDTVHLHGVASDPYGKIIKMAWDIGNTGLFVETSTGDTAFCAPSITDTNFKCIFRATDNDSNVSYDTVQIKVFERPALNGLVAYYPFNGNANDSSGNAFNGTNYGATPVSNRNGLLNSAYYLDGASYVVFPSSINLGKPYTQFTVALWYKAIGTGAVFGDYEGTATGGDDIFSVEFHIDNNSVHSALSSYLSISSRHVPELPTDSLLYVSQFNGIDSTWHFAAYQMDGVSKLTVWVDGIKVKDINYNPALDYNENPVWYAGRCKFIGSYDSQYFTGAVDDIRIYNRALSVEEIQGLYNERP